MVGKSWWQSTVMRWKRVDSRFWVAVIVGGVLLLALRSGIGVLGLLVVVRTFRSVSEDSVMKQRSDEGT